VLRWAVPLDLSLERFEERLAKHRPLEISRRQAPERAAVAALLRFKSAAPEVLLIQRVAHPGDRWSGQVSFPGGREEEEDADLLATAVRETREEVGLDLSSTARLLGRIDAVRAVAKGRFLPMSIQPFVFVQTQSPALALGSEATEAFWLPLDRVAEGALDDRFPYRLGPLTLSLPCWRWQGKVVWGLTYQMIRDLLRIVQG
jgi:8-oxo-dGTP pyrophosphatase MutT (NUDIX family)